MQDVKYVKQTQEHKQYRAEIKHLRKQIKEWTQIKDCVSPRPDWKRLRDYMPGITS
jgi:cell division septum initiation protein DivIVA